MKEISYKNITIGQVQCLNKSGYFSKIICDGDNLKVGLLEEEYIEAEKKIKKLIDDIMKPVVEVFEQIANTIAEISADIFDNTKKDVNNFIYTILDKKISKKKFIKLLQSEGVQRNEINKIVQGNKEKYTYLRYYNIVKNLYEKQ
jgi:Mg2+ and Co2+ transporter CorA